MYGATTLVLFIILIYTLLYFSSYSYDPNDFPFMTGKSNLFRMDMALTLFSVLTLVFVERYCSRCDTKAIEDKRLKLKIAGGEGTGQKRQGWFTSEEMFKRTTTARSMTI